MLCILNDKLKSHQDWKGYYEERTPEKTCHNEVLSTGSWVAQVRSLSNGTIVDIEEKEIRIFVAVVELKEIIMRLLMMWRDSVNIIQAGVGVIKKMYILKGIAWSYNVRISIQLSLNANDIIRLAHIFTLTEHWPYSCLRKPCNGTGTLCQRRFFTRFFFRLSRRFNTNVDPVCRRWYRV